MNYSFENYVNKAVGRCFENGHPPIQDLKRWVESEGVKSGKHEKLTQHEMIHEVALDIAT